MYPNFIWRLSTTFGFTHSSEFFDLFSHLESSNMATHIFSICQLLCLSDLELDYINPYDSTLRINKFVIPDFAIHGALSFTYLIFGFWLMFLLNLPLIYFHFRLYSRKHYLVDVTEIFNQLQYEKKYRFIKLIFYFILLCIIFVRMLVAAIA